MLLQATYRSEIVISVIPNILACLYVCPSTSLDTALVHSIVANNKKQDLRLSSHAQSYNHSPSKIANLGL